MSNAKVRASSRTDWPVGTRVVATVRSPKFGDAYLHGVIMERVKVSRDHQDLQEWGYTVHCPAAPYDETVSGCGHAGWFATEKYLRLEGSVRYEFYRTLREAKK